MPKFEVIQGTPAPDTLTNRVRANRRADEKPANVLQCPRCGSRSMIEERTGGHKTKAGKLAGGVTNIICASCMLRGERVVVG